MILLCVVASFAGDVVSIRGEIASGFEVFGLRLSCCVERIVWLDFADKTLEPRFTDIAEWAPVPDLLEYARRNVHTDLVWQPYIMPSAPVSVRNSQVAGVLEVCR